MIYPKKGDTIEYHVKFVDETPRIAKVLKTTKTLEGNWLFKCATDSGWINFYYITKIIKSSKIIPKPYNVHEFDEKDILFVDKRNQLTGSFHQILYYAAKRIPYKATQFIDYRKAIDLYQKTREGLIHREFKNVVYTVNKKRFIKWAITNYSKICETVKEEKERVRLQNEEDERQYYNDLEDFDDFDSTFDY